MVKESCKLVNMDRETAMIRVSKAFQRDVKVNAAQLGISIKDYVENAVNYCYKKKVDLSKHKA